MPQQLETGQGAARGPVDFGGVTRVSILLYLDAEVVWGSSMTLLLTVAGYPDGPRPGSLLGATELGSPSLESSALPSLLPVEAVLGRLLHSVDVLS